MHQKKAMPPCAPQFAPGCPTLLDYKQGIMLNDLRVCMRAHDLYILFVQSVHGLSWKPNTEHRGVHQKICRWLRVHVLRERDTYSSNAGPWKRSSSNGTDIEKWGGIKRGAPCGSYGVADVAGTKGRPALFFGICSRFPNRGERCHISVASLL